MSPETIWPISSTGQHIDCITVCMIIICSHMAWEEPCKKVGEMPYGVEYNVLLACYSAWDGGRGSWGRAFNPVRWGLLPSLPLPPQTVHNSWIRANSYSHLLLDLLSVKFSNPCLHLQIPSASTVSCSKGFQKFTNCCVKKCRLNCFKLILYYFNDCPLAPVLFYSLKLSHNLTLSFSSLHWIDISLIAPPYRAAIAFTFSNAFLCTVLNSTISFFRCKD